MVGEIGIRDPKTRAHGSVTGGTGVVPDSGQPAADLDSGALYSPDNGKTDQTGILTRYDAVTSLDDLPAPSPYFGYLEPKSGGTILRLHNEDGLQDTTQLETGFVTTDGTYNPVHNLPKNPPVS
ncbi:hypothetical protein K4749_39255 [Streptomyces sp. TRM72054]|uniref:hypothetical protein n=1 Tax=Streptomyces sp. TRM72054 TaxID=2870562 RepID=UPI001C8B503B|nr:hypothetical protein [Streptomyces sp. TRM72054]MBX9399423.1 hypothetical protein [Streptomyces sp. TRM72054]